MPKKAIDDMHESVDNHLNRDYALVKCNLFVQVFV